MPFNKSKIYVKTLKTLLHVSITRSSLGSMYAPWGWSCDRSM